MADNSMLKLLRIYILKLKSFLWSKDVLSFLLFLALSAGFWFVNALDKERETEITIPLRFVGLPQSIAITNSPTYEIKVLVKDQGLNLFRYYKKNNTELSIDVNRVFYEKGDIVISNDQIRAKLLRYLLPTTSLLELKPDSILIQYEKLSVKTLPIEFVSFIDLEHQYVLSDKIQLSPSKITVFGPKSVLDTLAMIKTEKIELKNLSDTTYLNCKLTPVKSVKFAAKETKVRIFVEMFTEKKIQLPVNIINCPDELNIRTFPAIVNVVFNVGMSHFNSIKSDDLSIQLDYADLIKDKAKQKLIIKNSTTYISNIRIVPQDVEYIIERK